jgi:hypothetical protein
MTHSFDQAYWQQHWQQTHGERPGYMAGSPPNPYLAQEIAADTLAEATVTLADITAGLDAAEWEIVTAEEHQRPVTGPGGQTVTLHDVVVRATRRP